MLIAMCGELDGELVMVNVAAKVTPWQSLRMWEAEAAEASCSFSHCGAREEQGKHTTQSIAATWQRRDREDI